MKDLFSNIAFKCTWNDAGFKGICSREAYEHNLSMNRAWCLKAECRAFTRRPTDENHPCYESILFSLWRFGAGWDHRNKKRPRKIKRAQIGKIALLTTLGPNKTEKDRNIISFFTIDKILEGQESETIVYGDPMRSLAIDPSFDVRFWHYYKNPSNPDRIAWSSGLFRYLSDEQILIFLKDLKQIYQDKGWGTEPLQRIDCAINGFGVVETTVNEKKHVEASSIICDNCGHDNLFQAKFCNRCGKAMGLRCSQCKTKNPPGSRFCFECGTELQQKNSLIDPQKMANKLIEFGKMHLEKSRSVKSWLFTPDIEADKLVRTNPQAYLFAVILDQGIIAEKVWKAPYELMKRMGHLDPIGITEMNIEQFEKYFTTPSKLHRFWPTMARRIHNASKLIVNKYKGSAANIWSDEPEARILYDRLSEFDGIGQKKASMAVNILFRDLGVKIHDKSGIDVSYDIMVRRVFRRTGLTKSDSLKEIVEAARKLNPSYPGELDYPAWIIGRTWCLPQRPKCSDCEISSKCSKIGVQ